MQVKPKKVIVQRFKQLLKVKKFVEFKNVDDYVVAVFEGRIMLKLGPHDVIACNKILAGG